MSRPEFVLVPGAWHAPASFDPTAKLLEKEGYTVHGVTLPSVGASPALKNFDPDVEAIKAVVNNVLAGGTDVVLCYHSYGSVPGSEALKEYVEQLENGGKEGHGRIKRLVFIASFVLSEGGSLMAALQFKPLPWFEIDGELVNPGTPKEIFYNDVSDDIAAPYIKALRPQSYPCFASTLTAAPWKVIPSTYIACEQDQAIPLPGQEGMIAMAKSIAPQSFDVVERSKTASHSPFISEPEWLAEKLAKAAQ